MSIKNPKKFLNKFFDTLKAIDFTNIYNKEKNPQGKATNVLNNFYRTYLKERTKYKSKELPLFEFYLEYLTRAIEEEPEVRESKKICLCEEIVDRIFHPEKYNVSSKKLIDDNNEHTDESPSVMPRNVPSRQKNKIVMNKRTCLKVLSDMLENTMVTIFEEPDKDQNSTNQIVADFKDACIDGIKQDIEKDVKKGLRAVGYVEGPKDASFQKIENALLIWKDTEDKCIKFLNQDKKFAMWYETMVFDALQIDLAKNNRIITVDNDGRDDKESRFLDILPVRELSPMWSRKTYNTLLHLKNEDYLSVALSLAHKKENFMLVLSGNKLIPGGGSDQGIITNETPLYYASSYHMSINKVSTLYPLAYYHLVYTPSVFVFRDHKNKYKLLKPHQGARVSVLTASSPYRPDTNISDIDRYAMDKRLWSQKTRYKHPNKLEQQMRYILNTCLFFGKDTIVISDRGIEDFWLPVHHTAEIIIRVMKEYYGKFAAVYLCITNPKIYKIFSKLI